MKPASGRGQAVAVAATAACYFVGAGLTPVPWLIWLAPIPVLVAGPGQSVRTNLIMGFASYALGGLNIVTYLSRLAPPPMVAAAVLVPALLFALAIAAHAAATARWRNPSAILAFPFVWTSAEFLLNRFSPDGTALNLAYTQASVLPLVQLASVTGIWGISFVVSLLPAALAAAWMWRQTRPLAVRTASLGIGVFALALGFGVVRLALAPDQPTLRIGAAATDATVDRFDATTLDQVQPVAAAYAARVAALATRGARAVVLPEKFVGVTPETETAVISLLAMQAQESNLTLVAGLNRIGRTPPRNTAFVFDPSGQTTVAYEKTHLVPGLEQGYLSGGKPAILTIDSVQVGVAICKDMDFPWWLRQYSARQVRLMLVPAWDFVVDGPLHARMAMFRGVEGGFSMVRSAQEGWVSVSDHLGRVLAKQATTGVPEAQLVHDVPLGPGTTIYSRLGDWFPWLAVALTLVGLGRYLTRRAPI